MRTRTSFHGNCRRREIRKILQHFFAVQMLVFSQPAVALMVSQMKNMLGNIHVDYGLILLVHFDSLCSLVKHYS